MSFKFNPFTGNLDQTGGNFLPLTGGTLTGDLSLPNNNIFTGGYMEVGGTTVPQNITPGDLSLQRLHIGDITDPLAADNFIKLFVIGTSTSSTRNFINNTDLLNPAGNSSTNFRGLLSSLQVLTGNVANFNNLVAVVAEVKHLGAGNITSTTAGSFAGFIDGNNFIAPAIVSSVYGARIQSVLGQNATGSVTTAYGVQIQDSVLGSGPLTIGNQFGIDIVSQTAGSSAIGLRIAKATTYAMQFSDTSGSAAGGITYNTDTNLYRSGAGTLKSDNTLNIVSNYQANGTAGVSGTFASGTHTVTVTNGLITSIL